MASSSRGRPKKVGLSRMDAAYDHLSPFGFSKQLISSTVKSLLKEYGGNDCWFFLEENAYKLVLDTILDRQTVTEKEEPLPQLPAPPAPAPAPSPAPAPAPAPEKENKEEQQQNGDSDGEMGMKEQRFCNGGGAEVATPVCAEIEFMDESLLHVIPPGRSRPFLYGYLSETDSDAEFDAISP